MRFDADLDSLGPVIDDPDAQHRVALLAADRLGHDCRDVLDMLGLVGR